MLQGKFGEWFCMFYMYPINPKYSDTLTPYHTCPKFWRSILLPINVSKILLYVWQTVQTLIRCCRMWCLIWVYNVCKGLSVPIFKIIPVNFVLCWGLTTRQPLRVILCHLPEKGRKEIGESRGDKREGQGRKRNRNESKETEEIKTFPLYPYPLQG